MNRTGQNGRRVNKPQAFSGAVAALGLMTIAMIWPSVEFPPGYEAALTTVLTSVVAYYTVRHAE